MWSAWLAAPDVDAASFRSVRLAVSGAARLPVDGAERFRERFGVTIFEGYGLTEAAPIVAAAAGDEPRPGSIGRPVPGLELRLVDDEGEDALAGDPGEVWVRGPNVFAGYWQDPEATATALTADGWLRTGDVAVADDDGWLSLVDRAKDLVIVSGFNVFPGEVEAALLDHPDVAAAAVVGVDHPQTGETVEAWVVPAPGASPDEADVIAFAATRLARYKCPTAVHVVPDLPQGPAGKVLRRVLRSPASRSGGRSGPASRSGGRSGPA
jgi:long-chain acyl-CoA synthetase